MVYFRLAYTQQTLGVLQRSPEAPKIIRTHESPVGSGSCDNFSMGLAWIIADIRFLSIDVLDIAFES
jgi:hypothetical protein